MTNLNRQKHNSNNLITKARELSLSKKAIIFILSMGSVGAAIGSLDNKISFEQCVKSEVCLTGDLAENRINRIAVGTVAGMIAASILSLPPILEEN